MEFIKRFLRIVLNWLLADLVACRELQQPADCALWKTGCHAFFWLRWAREAGDLYLVH